MKNIYKELSDSCYKKTVDIKKYTEYIKIYRNHKDTIWNFYKQNKVQSLELDSYINKKKALHTIVRRIVPKHNDSIEFNKSQNKHVNAKINDNVKNKPTLIAFGKGNGNITINNLKNGGPKGPVKALALELSKYCIVILTDEYNTSKICSNCQTQQLEHPMIKKTITKRPKDKDGKRQKKKVEVECENYNLCYCKNNIHQSKSDVHKIWNRDYNASKNILQTMVKKVTGKKLGIYTRKKLEKIAEDDIIINCSKGQLESNERSPNKKLSLTATTTTNDLKQNLSANKLSIINPQLKLSKDQKSTKVIPKTKILMRKKNVILI
jgi:hypothetical protein